MRIQVGVYGCVYVGVGIRIDVYVCQFVRHFCRIAPGIRIRALHVYVTISHKYT